jgi:kinesin family protein 11
MSETHASGVVALNELANTMQNKASSDLQQINTIISSQMRTVEQVCSHSKSILF